MNHIQRNGLSALFCMHELTEAPDWLVLLWLTADRVAGHDLPITPLIPPTWTEIQDSAPVITNMMSPATPHTHGLNLLIYTNHNKLQTALLRRREKTTWFTRAGIWIPRMLRPTETQPTRNQTWPHSLPFRTQALQHFVRLRGWCLCVLQYPALPRRSPSSTAADQIRLKTQ